MTRPNIIQIVVDDMGYGDLSSVNFGASSTPVLDQLSTNGVSLTQHYSASPVCAPARAALLTGQYPQRGGVIDTLEAYGTDRLSTARRTIADFLGAAGYATGLVGKWHNGAFDDRYHPLNRGFGEFLGFRGGWQDYWEWTLERDRAPFAADGRYRTDVFTSGAIDYIERHRNEPFFLHLAYNAPHFPFQAPEAEIDQFLKPGVSRRVATIYAMIQRVDLGIGRILQTLEERGLADNTIVMFMSDNGPQLDGEGEESTVRYNAGLRGAKQTVWEGGIRVPFIMRWPDGIEGRTSLDSLVHFTDWLPTLLDAAGVRYDPESFDGRSALPVLQGSTRAAESTRFWQWTRYEPLATSNAAMRDGDWKLLWPAWPLSLDATPADDRLDEAIKRDPSLFDPETVGARPTLATAPADAAPMLFNLRSDPAEAVDLAEAQPKRVASMARQLDNWFAKVEEDRREAWSADAS